MVNVSSFLWTSAGQKADGITRTHTHTHMWRTSTMSSRPLPSVSVGTRGVPGNYTTGWITCRSIDCRSSDCRSIDCWINGTTPLNCTSPVSRPDFAAARELRNPDNK